jgi:hypothetical protein
MIKLDKLKKLKTTLDDMTSFGISNICYKFTTYTFMSHCVAYLSSLSLFKFLEEFQDEGGHNKDSRQLKLRISKPYEVHNYEFFNRVKKFA